jgi:hypothetical protein
MTVGFRQAVPAYTGLAGVVPAVTDTGFRGPYPNCLGLRGTAGEAPPTPTPSVGGSISGGCFTRGRWRKLCREFEERAERIRRKRERAALQAALALARKATEAAEASAAAAAVEAELARAQRAIEAATGARRLGDVLQSAKRAEIHARAVMLAIAEYEEEEQIVVNLLLLN